MDLLYSNKKIKGNVDIVNHVQQNKVHVINGMRVMGENLNINSTQRIETKEVILDKKVQCLTAPKTLPPLKLVNPKSTYIYYIDIYICSI